MKYCELMFSRNAADSQNDKRIKNRLKFKNGRFYYRIQTDIFSGDHIYEIINVMNYIWRIYNQKIPITFELGSFEFYDKLVYIILESLCYYLLKEKGQSIEIRFHAKHTIWSEGIQYSPLRYIRDKNMFIRKYNSDLSMYHFRRLVPRKEDRNEKYLSKLMQDISCFLQNNAIDEETCEQLSEALVELVGNAGEHGDAESIIDIDITATDYGKKSDNEDILYYGMNAVVLNYSPVLFHEPLMKKLKNDDIISERYGLVKKAQKYHMSHLQENYAEEDFYTVSSFQHKISGSTEKNELGGTGLTCLLQSLEENSDTHLCYMLSGNRILFFEKDFMFYDKNNFVGFNESRNYLTDIPDVRLLSTIRTHVPGVAYNLNYAIKKEW